MLSRLLCNLLGHKSMDTRVEADGRTTLWCDREQREVVIFPGWDAINRGADT